jgi:hypothetical protein
MILKKKVIKRIRTIKLKDKKTLAQHKYNKNTQVKIQKHP